RFSSTVPLGGTTPVPMRGGSHGLEVSGGTGLRDRGRGIGNWDPRVATTGRTTVAGRAGSAGVHQTQGPRCADGLPETGDAGPAASIRRGADPAARRATRGRRSGLGGVLP